MKNPYEVLDVNQDATKDEIQAAFLKAQRANIKTKKYDGRDLMEARNQLMNPAKRLVADFLFPAKFKGKRPKIIDIEGIDVDENMNYQTLHPDALDSLKFCNDYV